MVTTVRSKVMLTAASVAMLLPTNAGAANSILSLETGHSVVITGHNIGRVAVGDGRVAGAVPLDPHEIVINAKSAGETTIFVWDDNVRRSYELTVTEHRLDQIARLLQRSLNDPDLQVTVLGETILVGGHVPDLSGYQKVQDTIAQYKGLKFEAGVTEPVVINTVAVVKPLGDLERRMSAIPNARDLRFDLDENGDIVVSGRVRDRQVEQNVIDSVNALAGPFLKTTGKVVDRLLTDAKSLVDIKVDVLEVDKTGQSQLGLRLQAAQESTIGSNGNQTYTIAPQPSIVAIEDPTKATTFNHVFDVGPFGRVSLLAPTLDLLISQGHARLLSSPNLVTKPGKLASFLVGGQIPIPTSNGLGTVTVEYKDFGVKLNVTPTIDADGGVESEITPEISDLDFADGVQLNGFTIPALKISRISTDIVTNDGESIVMGGLLRRVESKNIQKIPLLGDIPVLGQLFRSTSYQKTDTDVVFVMTPYIVTKHNVTNARADEPSRAPIVNAQPIAPVPAPASTALPTSEPSQPTSVPSQPGPQPSSVPLSPATPGSSRATSAPTSQLPAPAVSSAPHADLHPEPVANLARVRSEIAARSAAPVTVASAAFGETTDADRGALENYEADTETAWLRTTAPAAATTSPRAQTRAFAYFGATGPAITRHYLALVQY